MSRKYKKMSEKEFEQLKYMLSVLNMPIQRVTEITSRTYNTLHEIKNTTNFADYIESVRKKVAIKASRKANKSSPSILEGNEPKTEAFTQNHDEILHVLNRINDNFARLVEAWQARPSSQYETETRDALDESSS